MAGSNLFGTGLALPDAEKINASQYGWSTADLPVVKQLLDYLNEAESLVEDLRVIETQFNNIATQVQNITDIDNKITSELNLFEQHRAEVTDIYNQVIIYKDDIDKAVVTFTALKTELEAIQADVTNKSATVTADAADVATAYTAIQAINAAVTADAAQVKTWRDESENFYNLLKGGKVYRGLWNPVTDAYPTNHQGQNSYWDVALPAGTNTHDYDGKSWKSGDQLVYLVEGAAYSQIISQTVTVGVASVNGLTGAVVLDAAKINAATAKALTTEDLDTINVTGIYTQPSNAAATTALHYPIASAGFLTVANDVVQTYTTYTGHGIYIRSKSDSGGFSSWFHIPNSLSPHFLDSVTIDGTADDARLELRGGAAKSTRIIGFQNNVDDWSLGRKIATDVFTSFVNTKTNARVNLFDNGNLELKAHGNSNLRVLSSGGADMQLDNHPLVLNRASNLHVLNEDGKSFHIEASQNNVQDWIIGRPDDASTGVIFKNTDAAAGGMIELFDDGKVQVKGGGAGNASRIDLLASGEINLEAGADDINFNTSGSVRINGDAMFIPYTKAEVDAKIAASSNAKETFPTAWSTQNYNDTSTGHNFKIQVRWVTADSLQYLVGGAFGNDQMTGSAGSPLDLIHIPDNPAHANTKWKFMRELMPVHPMGATSSAFTHLVNFTLNATTQFLGIMRTGTVTSGSFTCSGMVFMEATA